MLIVSLPREERVLHLGVVYDRARLWRAVRERVLGITAEVTVLSAVSLVTFALNLLDVVEGRA